MWKRFMSDYLSYSYKERTGIFILLAFIVLCISIPFLYPFFIAKKHYDPGRFKNEMAKLQPDQTDSFPNKKLYAKNPEEDNPADYAAPSDKNYYPKSTSEVFDFDPNNTSSSEWKRLGLKDKTIETIQKYLSKGGHFYKPGDIAKIWGLYPEQVKRLLPYVKITLTNNYVKNDPSYFADKKKTSYVAAPLKQLDINTADTSEFIALPGIGSKLAQRIVNFRNKLGGFYTVDQVGETFGLPDSTFQKIKARLILPEPSVKRININTASADDLKAHPYIRYAIANAIVQYRNQHGNFSAVSDLKKIMLVTEDAYKKMEPYLTIAQ